MISSYKAQYPKKDIRIMLPFYNFEKANQNGKYYYEVFGSKDKFSNPIKFELEDTGIENEFNFGVKKSKAKLYKSKNKELNCDAYFVHFPELNRQKKPFDGDFPILFEDYCAFSSACVALLEKLRKSKVENFNPSIMHTNDWETAYAIYDLKNNSNVDNKEIKTVHELMIAGKFFQGKVNPLLGALNVFSKQQIEKLKNIKELKTQILHLTVNEPYLLLSGQKSDLTNIDLNKKIDDLDFYNNILLNISKNYYKIFDTIINLINNINLYYYLILKGKINETFSDRRCRIYRKLFYSAYFKKIS